MKINYDFYSGYDAYSDGDIEKDILAYEDQYRECDYDKIFEKDSRWPIFYHLTSIRKNILNWYPFKEGAHVLEIGAGMGAITGVLADKAEHVTAVELSKQRASSIAKRCADRENVEIIVGNFNDIKFDKKFDYITLIGVLEYAPVYTQSEQPFEDFLIYIKSLLKEDGKLLIAIENQFGIKYFAGAAEDHTTKKYDGILGYEHKEGPRTFGKVELERLLNSVGYRYSNFYYPMPDYKLPRYIFSDEYLPMEKLALYDTYTSAGEVVSFDEKKALKDIVKNGMFGFFANSFFIECSTKEIDTMPNLDMYHPIEPEKNAKRFFETHNTILESTLSHDLYMANEENQALKKQLHELLNSKSYKLIQKIRRFVKG